METIKLMADYRSWPLWWAGRHEPGNINPDILPLSVETRDRLRKWAAAYDATLNWDDPASSGFPSEAAREAFHKEGMALWEQLQCELGPSYLVLYQGPRDQLPRYPSHHAS